MVLVPDIKPFIASAPIVGAELEIDSYEWDDLAAEASEPTMFCESWFLAPALQFLREEREIRLLRVRDDEGRLIGIMPLIMAPFYGRIPVLHVSNWIHYQCFMGSPLVRKGAETGFWRAVITLLDESRWAKGMISFSGLLKDGPVHISLIQVTAELHRPCPIVHSYKRAALSSDLAPDAYLEATIRPKKRKELRRLSNRLADRGIVNFDVLRDAPQISPWCEDFLTLEAAGWKGEHGAALGRHEATAAFFRKIVAGAFAAGRLDFQRLTLDERIIAMLVNFRTPPGSWSFKIAYDEGLARFSPGVLIELENLTRILNDADIAWMDSCAVKDHPMINSLWGERRTIIQVSMPLAGLRRGLIYRFCRTVETGSAWLRRLRTK